MNILAIESSCDETAAAVVKDGRTVLSNVVFSQVDLHKVYGGVVPEIASRSHIEKITPVVNEAIEQSKITEQQIDAVAVTAAPGLVGALLVGLNFAKGLSYRLKKPLVPVHHIRAHIAANYLVYPKLCPPFIAMVVSGGHSHIILVKDYTSFEVVGATRDDAAGEAFDKGARVLGLSYPGGVQMDKLAQAGNRYAIKFPKVSFNDAPFDFSFSGVKTSIINYVHNAKQKDESIVLEDVAASYSEAITDVLCDKFYKAAEKFGQHTLVVAGGVSANSMLREKLSAKKSAFQQLYMPPLSLCGDNAAMVASQGYYEFLDGYLADYSQNAIASIDIEKGLCKQNR